MAVCSPTVVQQKEASMLGLWDHISDIKNRMHISKIVSTQYMNPIIMSSELIQK